VVNVAFTTENPLRGLAHKDCEEMVVRKFLVYAHLAAKCLRMLVGRGGFEPPTNGLKVL
jgi:hypothetical protein